MIFEIIAENLKSYDDIHIVVRRNTLEVSRKSTMNKMINGRQCVYVYQKDDVIIVVTRVLIIGHDGHCVPDIEEFTFYLYEPDSISNICDLIVSKIISFG